MGVFIYNLTEGIAVKAIDAMGPFGAQCLDLQAVWPNHSKEIPGTKPLYSAAPPCDKQRIIKLALMA